VARILDTRIQGGYKQAGSPGDPTYLGVPHPAVTTSTAPQGGTTVASQTYHNVSLGYAFGRATRRVICGAFRSRSPSTTSSTRSRPFDAAAVRTPFFYSRYGNVRLRDYIIRVKKDF
jgi:hypothetical protein